MIVIFGYSDKEKVTLLKDFFGRIKKEACFVDEGALSQTLASILKGDLKTQAECITKYLQSGVYTINEARKKAGLPAIDGGDVIVMNGSYVPLEKLGIAYEKGGAKSE